jgi:hypothetical protein
MTDYPPKDHQAMVDGCTCAGRAEGKHDLCCEWVLRGAGLLPSEITPEAVTTTVLTEWGVRYDDTDGRRDIPYGTTSFSEQMARIDALRDGAEVVTRTITYGAWGPAE